MKLMRTAKEGFTLVHAHVHTHTHMRQSTAMLSLSVILGLARQDCYFLQIGRQASHISGENLTESEVWEFVLTLCFTVMISKTLKLWAKVMSRNENGIQCLPDRASDLS